MKFRFTGTAAALIAAVLFFQVEACAISAQKAVLMDAPSGNMIFSLRADEKSLIASTTKIMTALLICEKCNVLECVQVPDEAIGIEGSSMYLRSGEALTVQDLLYGLMMASGNDAAVALAIHCSGSVDNFCSLMNAKARTLGLKGTHFANPHGLDAPEHYSTAEDLAVLAAYAMKNPIFAKTVSTKTIHAADRFLKNHNKLLWLYNDADGVKTGYTKAAGRILVSSACRDNRRLIAVTINAPGDWQDHQRLLDSGFAKYKKKTLVTSGQTVGSAEVAGGTSQTVPLIAASDFCYPMAETESFQLLKSSKNFVYAPVVSGADAGFVYVLIKGNAVGRIPVVYGKTVEIDEQPQKRFGFIRKRKSNAGATSENYSSQRPDFTPQGGGMDPAGEGSR